MKLKNRSTQILLISLTNLKPKQKRIVLANNSWIIKDNRRKTSQLIKSEITFNKLKSVERKNRLIDLAEGWQRGRKGKDVILTMTLIKWSGFNLHPGHVVASLDKTLDDDYLC